MLQEKDCSTRIKAISKYVAIQMLIGQSLPQIDALPQDIVEKQSMVARSSVEAEHRASGSCNM